MKFCIGFIFVLLFAFVFDFQLSSVELEDVHLGRQLLIDDAFNIYTGANDHQIAKYSPEGKQLFLIGRKGEGPGDIKRLGWMSISSNNSFIYVTEIFGGNRRISVFSTEDGRFVKIWPCQLDSVKWPSIPFIQFDRQGNVYLQVENIKWRRRGNIEIGSTEKVIMKFDHKGRKIKELYHLASDVTANCKTKGNFSIPFRNNLRWLIHQGKLYIHESREEYISVFNLDGSPVKKIPLPFSKIPVTKKDIDAWEEWVLSFPIIRQEVALGRTDVKFWKKNLPFPAYKAICDGLLLGPENTIYSHKVPQLFNEKGGKELYAVIPLESGETRLRAFPKKHRLLAIKNNLFYFNVRTDDDEEFLKIFTEKDLKAQYLLK